MSKDKKSSDAGDKSKDSEPQQEQSIKITPEVTELINGLIKTQLEAREPAGSLNDESMAVVASIVESQLERLNTLPSVAGSTELSEEEIEHHNAVAVVDQSIWEQKDMARAIARACVTSSDSYKNLAGGLFSSGRRGDHETVGALLAEGSWRVAGEYLAALDEASTKERDSMMEALAVVDEPGSEENQKEPATT